MHGIIGLLPRRKMALRVAAIRRDNLQIVVVVDVARCARNVGVAVRQREAGRTVVECRPQPTVKFVAALAIPRCESRSGGGVRRIGGVLPILQVTRLASRGQSQEHSRCGLLVAFIALHGGMSAKERKPVLVIAHLLHRDIPALHGVALCAVRTHLAAVDIRVAIRAVLANVGKYGFHVALGALHFFVQAAEWIFRFAVIEFGNRADGSPSGRGVAVFARNIQRTMGISLGFLLSGARSGCR